MTTLNKPKRKSRKPRKRPRILLPSNGVIPPVLPPSPLTSPEVDAFCRILADIIQAEELPKEQSNND